MRLSTQLCCYLTTTLSLTRHVDVESFSPSYHQIPRSLPVLSASSSSDNQASQTQTSSTQPSPLQENVNRLKKVLEREYITFFDPMKTEYYEENVTFQDPMTSLSGVQSYKNNVDMLAGRTFLGSILFNDAGINLHSVTGGEVSSSDKIDDIITRWTLSFQFKAIPWKPTARFSGISVYKVKPTSVAPYVQITAQLDYWDSINITPETGGDYAKVDTTIAIKDFLNQVKPNGFEAASAAPELPYELLRRGNGYEVRRYPPYASIKLPYLRRDEGFGSLGSFTRGMNPLSPAIMEVKNDDTANKYMKWPVSFALPGKEMTIPVEAKEKAGKGQFRTITIDRTPSNVVAVAELPDASMAPVVRFSDRRLRRDLERDGLVPVEGTEDGVRFAQYDAIFSMGKRRGEIWIDLEDHPW